MNIQIFGRKKSSDSRKAERYFKERKIPFQYIDMDTKGMSRGELDACIRAAGIDTLIDYSCKDRGLAELMKYISDDAKAEKMAEYPGLVKVPVVRNGNQVTAGYMPDVWKGWI